MKNPLNISQKNSIQYDDFGETFGKSRHNLHWAEIDRVLDDFLLNFHPSSGALGDIGCGNGRLLSHIIKHPQSNLYKSIFSMYVGLDNSHILLEQARANIRLKNIFPSINWREGDMHNLDKELREYGSFDVLFFIASFHHLNSRDERIQILHKARKILSPGGKIVMINWNLLDASQTQYQNSQIAAYPDGSADYSIKIGAHTRFYHAFSSEEYHSLSDEVGLDRVEEIFGKRNSILILQ